MYKNNSHIHLFFFSHFHFKHSLKENPVPIYRPPKDDVSLQHTPQPVIMEHKTISQLNSTCPFEFLVYSNMLSYEFNKKQQFRLSFQKQMFPNIVIQLSSL